MRWLRRRRARASIVRCEAIEVKLTLVHLRTLIKLERKERRYEAVS